MRPDHLQRTPSSRSPISDSADLDGVRLEQDDPAVRLHLKLIRSFEPETERARRHLEWTTVGDGGRQNRIGRDDPWREQLATTKKQVELKQQQIAAAELEATQDDAAELERLRQKADILETRKGIGETSLALDPAAQEVLALQQEIGLLKATRQASAAGRALAAELQFGDLRLEIERLRVENNLLKAKEGDS